MNSVFVVFDSMTALLTFGIEISMPIASSAYSDAHAVDHPSAHPMSNVMPLEIERIVSFRML